MNTTMANIEAHMQYVTTKQLQDAVRNEQLRIAKANKPGTIETIVAKMQYASGNILISIGARLQARHEALEAERLQVNQARTA